MSSGGLRCGNRRQSGRLFPPWCRPEPAVGWTDKSHSRTFLRGCVLPPRLPGVPAPQVADLCVCRALGTRRRTGSPAQADVGVALSDLTRLLLPPTQESSAGQNSPAEVDRNMQNMKTLIDFYLQGEVRAWPRGPRDGVSASREGPALLSCPPRSMPRPVSCVPHAASGVPCHLPRPLWG